LSSDINLNNSTKRSGVWFFIAGATPSRSRTSEIGFKP
jgi:hypothetical protein